MTALSPAPGGRGDGAATDAVSRDAKVIGLVSGGHFFSHFYGLVLPPLFPLLKAEFGVSYAALGMLVSGMSLASGAMQLPVGFLVDRFGPVLLLAAGLAIEATATLLMGLSSTFGMLLVLVMFAGIGNSVFHPADYTILSWAVKDGRLGRAFSVHTFAGHLGWAVAPVLMAACAAAFGWRAGLVAVGVVGLAAAVLILVNRGLLYNRPKAPEDASGGPARPAAGGMRLFATRPIMMCFLFFVLIAMSMLGFETFLVSALVTDRGASLSAANLALTAIFAGSATGVLVGGVIADRTRRHSLVAALGLGAAAALIVVAGEAALTVAALTVVIALAGFASGLVPPSRDLIVRSVTPEGSTGKVFGFVSVGLDVGGVVTPLVYGWVLDAGGSRWMYWLTAIILVAAIATVSGTRRARASPGVGAHH